MERVIRRNLCLGKRVSAGLISRDILDLTVQDKELVVDEEHAGIFDHQSFAVWLSISLCLRIFSRAGSHIFKATYLSTYRACRFITT